VRVYAGPCARCGRTSNGRTHVGRRARLPCRPFRFDGDIWALVISSCFDSPRLSSLRLNRGIDSPYLPSFFARLSLSLSLSLSLFFHDNDRNIILRLISFNFVCCAGTQIDDPRDSGVYNRSRKQLTVQPTVDPVKARDNKMSVILDYFNQSAICV